MNGYGGCQQARSEHGEAGPVHQSDSGPDRGATSEMRLTKPPLRATGGGMWTGTRKAVDANVVLRPLAQEGASGR